MRKEQVFCYYKIHIIKDIDFYKEIVDKILISYSDNKYRLAQRRLIKSATSKKGITKIITYNDTWLKKQEFYEENKDILVKSRGAGYMIWKPYIIINTLKRIKEDDFLIYADSDMVILNSLDKLYEICKQNNGLVLFDNFKHKNKSWIKRDCFILMGADEQEYHESFQCMSGFLILQKREWVLRLMEEWLFYAKDYRIVTDADNELGFPNLPSFVEHRHDQSILSILCKKHNLVLFRDPTQYGNSYKLKEFRENSEFLPNGKYESDHEIKTNSPYGALIQILPVPIQSNRFKYISKKLINSLKSLLSK